MPGICQAMPFSMGKQQKKIVLAHFQFVKEPKSHPPNGQFGFYILPNKWELWSLPLVNCP